MEGFTWIAHKYVMHGFLWSLHKDHHSHNKSGYFERNDYFFVIFAIPAIILIFAGAFQGYSVSFYVGIGITIYGIAYFVVHDLFIHQRIKVLRNTQNPYLKAIRRAHKEHHKHTRKEDGECFGFLWILPVKYFGMYFKSKKR